MIKQKNEEKRKQDEIKRLADEERIRLIEASKNTQSSTASPLKKRNNHLKASEKLMRQLRLKGKSFMFSRVQGDADSSEEEKQNVEEVKGDNLLKEVDEWQKRNEKPKYY